MKGYTPDYWYSYSAEKYWKRHPYEEYECPDCDRGVKRVWRFEVHHIDGDPSNHGWDNLIGLCRRCRVWRIKNSTMSGLDAHEWMDAFKSEVMS